MLPLRDTSTLSFLHTVFQNQHPRMKDAISLQNTEERYWEFKTFSPLSKCQHCGVPMGKGKKRCLHSQGPNACSSFPCHQMPPYCITQPRDLSPITVFLHSIVTNSKILNILKLESSRKKNRNKLHTKKKTSNKRHYQYCLFTEVI